MYITISIAFMSEGKTPVRISASDTSALEQVLYSDMLSEKLAALDPLLLHPIPSIMFHNDVSTKQRMPIFRTKYRLLALNNKA